MQSTNPMQYTGGNPSQPVSAAFGHGSSNVGRELTQQELEAVSGGSYNASLGAAVSLVVAGAALAGAAPVLAGALVVGSIGASGVAIFRSWHRLDEES